MQLQSHPACRPFHEAGELTQLMAYYEEGRNVMWMMLRSEPRPCFNQQLVTDIMAEISAASAEQSAGVSQVGAAVTRMDETTQQNASLVQQSAAAAESLKTQAQQLVQAVAVFKLAQNAHAAEPSLSF